MATWPFQNTRSPRSRSAASALVAMRRSERRLLHVAVARAGDAAGGERNLHETRTVEPERGLAAPQIGHAEKALGDRDEIAFVIAERREMCRRHIGAARRHRHAIGDARDSKRCAERQRLDGRQFDRRAGKRESPQRRDLVRRRSARGRERIRRQPADIIVGRELAPGKAFRVGVVDRDALALERFGVERRIGPRLAAERRLRLDHFHDAALDEARRGDFALQMLGREIGARRRNARIEAQPSLSRSAPQAAHRARAPPASRRPRAGRLWPWPSRRRRRNAATTSRSRNAA